MDDLISRRAAINALDDNITIQGITNAFFVMNYVKRVKQKLEQLQSEPKRKNGEWMFDDPISADFGCSECFHRQDYCTRYCPNCGAEMVTEE